MKLIFDDFALAIPSIGDVRFQDTAKHPHLLDGAVEAVQAFVRFGTALDDNILACREPSEQLDEIAEREIKKWRDRDNPTEKEIEDARRDVRAEFEEVENDRRRDLDDVLFWLTSGGRPFGAWALTEPNIQRIVNGVRVLQSQSALLRDVRPGADNLGAYADASYELWVALLSEPSIPVTPGMPVRFGRWYFPNKKRTSPLVRRVQQRWTANEIDVVGWPRSVEEEQLGVVRTKYVTLRGRQR